MTNPPKNQPTFHINSVGNLNTGDVTIAGDQIGTQNIQQESQDTALLALAQPPEMGIVQIIQELEKKYTFVQDPQQAIDIIDAEFKALEADRWRSLPERESPQWQNLLNVKRLYNGGKKQPSKSANISPKKTSGARDSSPFSKALAKT